MPCCCSSSSLVNIAGKAVLLVVLGVGIGLIDSWRRTLVIDRKMPVAPVSAPGGSPNTKPHDPAADPTKPTTPSTPTSNPGTTPGHDSPVGENPNWKPTPKDQLPQGQLTLEEAKSYFDQQATKPVKFVDARAKDKYEAGHVAGAMRMDLASFAGGSKSLTGLLAHDDIIIVYCSGGNCDESDAVANMLTAFGGYPNIWILHDGFPGWNQMHYPVETGQGTQPE
jgi:rhodanese-related sulfurtransferase